MLYRTKKKDILKVMRSNILLKPEDVSAQFYDYADAVIQRITEIFNKCVDDKITKTMQNS